MKKFKYPLSIRGPISELEAIVPELELLGYQMVNPYRDDASHKFLVTNFGSFGVCHVGFNQDKHHLDTTLLELPHQKELALALAAMVEDTDFYAGEYVVRTMSIWSSELCGNYPKGIEAGSIAKVLESKLITTSELYSYWAMRVSIDGNEYGFCSDGCRKATKEEIINHFMGPTKTVQVSEDFVRQAHAEACSEWKQKIEKEFPSLFKIELKEFDVYAHIGSSEKYCLISYPNDEWRLIASGRNDSWTSQPRSRENTIKTLRTSFIKCSHTD